MEIKLPHLRPIIVLADDWSLFEKDRALDKNFYLTPLWICGWLIQETDKTVAIALEYGEGDDEDEEHCQKTVVIPKSCIRYRKFLPIGKKTGRRNP